MDVDLVFKIAAIGILVAVLNILLSRAGRDEQALMTTIAGLVVVLVLVISAGMLAFMGVGTGDVSHTGLVTEQGTVIHSSKSRGGVVETALTAKAGWNGLGVHRMIAVAENADAAPTGTAYIVCAQTGLRMRTKPDVRGEYMQMLPDGAVIVALETRAGWIKTTYKGYTGWVSGEYCCKAGED